MEENQNVEPMKISPELGAFLQRNRLSGVGESIRADEKATVVTAPWGEASMVLVLPQDASQLEKHLKHIFLPPRLSAILHTDTDDLEIVWTAYKPPASITEIQRRSFIFRFDEIDYACEFGPASERLLAIAESYQPVGQSDTGYRNLISFKRFLNEGNLKPELFGEPTSFWIRNIGLGEDELIELLQNLNFYLTYYDRKSPTVLIHPPVSTSGSSSNFVRFRHGKFPNTINSRRIDTQLLQFTAACHGTDSARRFLYAYRIVEHSAFSFVESAPRMAVKKILSTPHALDDVAKVTQQVVAAVQKSKIDDYAKFEQLLSLTVDPEILWLEIENNLSAFSTETVFDGDFRLPALVASSASKPDFILNGIKNFCNNARKIRNALSHGKEERQASVITPTTPNYEKLAPWSHLMWMAAGEVILYDQ
ncbi:UNVERIFIED_ORG: hypothetical protein J2W66_003145 [Agrobacterium larrymoorei]|nr:hypothetical protein [Agrobacterium larrymoorei]